MCFGLEIVDGSEVGNGEEVGFTPLAIDPYTLVRPCGLVEDMRSYLVDETPSDVIDAENLRCHRSVNEQVEIANGDSERITRVERLFIHEISDTFTV